MKEAIGKPLVQRNSDWTATALAVFIDSKGFEYEAVPGGIEDVGAGYVIFNYEKADYSKRLVFYKDPHGRIMLSLQ